MNNVAKIKLLDEINIAIIGVKPADLKVLSNIFAVYAKAYNFHPLYKLRKWDGKIRFFTEAGASYYNLLPEIVPELKKLGYSIEWIDKRAYHNIKIPKVGPDYLSEWGWELGEHQVNAINTIATEGNGMLIAGTGAGKTLITAVLCDLYESACGLKTIIIVPNTDLIGQTVLELRGFDLKVGEYSGAKKSLEEPIIVSTWQALQNNPTIMSQFQAVIVDECHGTTGKILQDILNVHGAHVPVRIGMTGTLPKEPVDKMAIRVCLGDVLYEVKAYELMEKGWLAALRIKMYNLLEDFKDEWETFQFEHPEEAEKLTYKTFVETMFPDYDAEGAYLIKQKTRNIFIADLIENMRCQEKGNTFVLVKSVAYGKMLAKLVENAVFVYGADKTAVRKQIYKTFDDNDNVVVISTMQLASTGLNIKRIFNLVFIDAGKSFTKIIQAIGRGLRKAHDKDAVTVYDIYSNLKYAKRHAAQRKSYYKESKYEYTVKEVNYEAFYK